MCNSELLSCSAVSVYTVFVTTDCELAVANGHQSHKLKHSVDLSPPVGVIRHKLRLEIEY